MTFGLPGALARLDPRSLVLAAARGYGYVPVIGRHLAPLASLTALAPYGSHYAPATVRAAVTRRTGSAQRSVAESLLAQPTDGRMPPYLRAARLRRRWLHRDAVQYGSHPEQRLEVWRRPDLPATPAPVLLYVPGGAWVHGSRRVQGAVLLDRLVRAGWVCLTMDYRVSPRHRWPRQIRDVNAAIAWARAHAAEFGGDQDFVAIAGASAGGHLASLAALSQGDPMFRGELGPAADTSVDAVVGLYGRYDWQDAATPLRRNFMSFLERVVVQRSASRHPEIFTAASPILRVGADAPPFLLVHGELDTIIPVGEARDFADALGAVSRAGVRYVEFPRAGHAFDLVDAAHAHRCAGEVTAFLGDVYRRARRPAEAV